MIGKIDHLPQLYNETLQQLEQTKQELLKTYKFMANLIDVPNILTNALILYANGPISGNKELKDALKKAIDADDAASASALFQYSQPDQVMCPLAYACSQGKFRAAFGLLKRKDVNAPSKDGRCPIHILVENDLIFYVRYLISAGARLDVRDNKNETPLSIAINRGHCEIVKLLYENGVSPLDYPKSLHVAAKNGDLEMISLLLSMGVDVNSLDRNGNTPLVYAISYKQNDALQILCGAGGKILIPGSAEKKPNFENFVNNFNAFYLSNCIDFIEDINAKDVSGNTLLHYAVAKKQEKTTKILINKGANIHINNLVGKSPVDIANESHNFAIINMLTNGKITLDKAIEDRNDKLGAKMIDSHEKYPLVIHRTISNGMIKTTKALIKAGIDLNETDEMGRTPLFIAVQINNEKLVKILIDKGVDVNRCTSKLKPLHLAVKQNNEKIMDMLIDAGADLNVKDCNGRRPLFYALDSNIMLIRKLIEYGCDIEAKDSDEQTALLFAIRRKMFQQASLLLSYGADINNADKTGESAITVGLASDINIYSLISNEIDKFMDKINNPQYTIHLAARDNQSPIIRAMVIDQGISPDLFDNKRRTPLHVAIENNRITAAVTLIMLNANIELPNTNGETPLILAIKEGNVNITKLLLKRGAYIDVCDKMKMTPLHHAIKAKSEIILNILLYKRANASVPNINGVTPLMMAAKSGNINIVKRIFENCTNPKAKDNEGKTALDHAKEIRDNTKVINFLQGNGLNTKNKNKGKKMNKQ